MSFLTFQELVSQRSDQAGLSPDKSSSSAHLASSLSPSNSSSPARKKEELKEKLALLNSRYVSKGEKQEKQDLEDRAATQEAALLSEEVTPTNDMGFLRFDPVTNRLTLEQENSLASGSPKK